MAQRFRIRNRSDLKRVEEGDLIECVRKEGYKHWGVYVGNEDVVHLTAVDHGPIKGKLVHVFTVCGNQYEKADVTKDNIWKVADGDPLFVNNTNDADIKPRPKREIVREALSKIGPAVFNLMTKNCEHFAKFCRYGKERSDQVLKVLSDVERYVETSVDAAAIAMAPAPVRAGAVGLAWYLGGENKKK